MSTHGWIHGPFVGAGAWDKVVPLPERRGTP